MRHKMAMRPASPPTVPPAMAPTFVFFPELLGVGDPVAGRARVAALVAKEVVIL
jgi:hypothetical protein